MQNGLNPRVVEAAVGASRTLGACINSMGADYLRPGRIMFGGPGTIYLGELDGRRTSRVERLAEIVKTAFVANTHVTSNLWGHLWSKEGYGAMLFASATTDETMANVLSDAANQSLLANLAGEVVCVAEAEGVRCEPFDGFDPDAMRFKTPRDWARIRRSLDSLAELNRRSLKQKSGIWRDLAVRHRPTEVDAQIGIVSEIGRTHGISVPLIDRVVELIHEIERGDRRMHPANLEGLRTLDKRSYPEPSSK
jgi:2-dehydropantoate 2-reductase